MKIVTGTQIREADSYTIAHEPIESLGLMERASEVIAQWVCNHIAQQSPLLFVVGKGNNGGDGLAVARMLQRVGYRCAVVLVFDKAQLSDECRQNLERLPKGVKLYRQLDQVPLTGDSVVVDALFGSGVHGEVTGPAAEAIEWINASGCRIVSIDLPSGMQTEYGNRPEQAIVRAGVTLALEFPKLALLLPEAGDCAGEVVILPIELDADFIARADSPYYYVTGELVRSLLLPRPKFGHKGNFGHLLLVCGSEGMAGAAVMAAGGALRSGCGLVTVHLPREERFALHANCPSAMVSCDPQPHFSELPRDPQRFDVVAVGPGLGQHPESAAALERLLRLGRPMLIDADGLNLLAANPAWLALIPAGSVLTPHPGELRRLVGEWQSDRQRNELVRDFAQKHNLCMVVKGAHTMTCTPQGECYFNSTGNPGMAKGGSGDVLAGLVAGLMARGYAATAAALLGVYLHGAAGDKAAAYFGQEGMNAGDLADFIAEAGAELCAPEEESARA